MEKTGCKIICGAPMTLAVRELIMMMMCVILTSYCVFLDSCPVQFEMFKVATYIKYICTVDIRHRVCRLPYLRCFSYTHARTHSGLAPRTRRDPFRYHTLSSASTADCLSDCRLLITACVLYLLVVAYLL